MTLTIWLVLIIIAASILALYFRQRVVSANAREDDLRQQFKEQVADLKAAAYKHSVEAAIHRSLSQMDRTCDFYTDEDEANRELTTCLNLLGHSAQYHYPISKGRTADIFVDNIIIEGKLHPKQSDVDRLIGQVDDYLALPYPIYIVLYGQTDPLLLARIKSQICDRHPDRVSVVYLPDAKRVKHVADEERTHEASRIVFARS